MIKIDLESFVPIYEQVKEQIKRRIAAGDWKANELLPSIRELASDLLINPNTVARAYRDLENEGLIYKRKGMGCYVSENSRNMLEKIRGRMIDGLFSDCIAEAAKMSLSREEIEKRFRSSLKALFKAGNKRGDEDGNHS